MLRSPPLKNATVAAYVLDAIKAEELPCELSEIGAVLNFIPKKYRGAYTGCLGRRGWKGWYGYGRWTVKSAAPGEGAGFVEGKS